MVFLYLLGAVFLTKVILESPVGRAMADSIRNLTAPAAPKGAASLGQLEDVRRDIEDLRDQVDRIVEEQSFITKLLTESRPRVLRPGEVDKEIIQED